MQVLVFNLGKEYVMKRYVGGVLLGLVVVLSSCKPIARQESASDPERAVSDNGTILTAMSGKEGGICMVRSSARGEAKSELLTANGAIDDKQLKKALKFMSYGEQIGSIVVSLLISGVATGVGAAALLSPTPQTKKAMGAYAVSLVSLAGGVFGYRVVRGNMEGEKAGPIAGQTFLAGGGPIVEYVAREGRIRKVLSDKEEYKFTDKRMVKLIANIKGIYPAYPGGCDHIKRQLR